MRTALLLTVAVAACARGGTPTVAATPAAVESSDGSAAPSPTDQAQAEPAVEQPGTDDDQEGAEPAIEAWARVLDRFVTDDGGFRYAALIADAGALADLDAWLRHVATIDLDPLERDARLALLINAYNAYTLKSVIELWPVESVLAEPGFFDARTHMVAGSETTLNGLENDRIRAVFGEPRIHFLVNCASTGCPPLAPVPVTADNLESLLEEHTRQFVRATVRPTGDSVELSQIFEWFAADFEPAGGVRAFVASYLEAELAERVLDDTVPLRFTPYDWSLNGRE